MTEHSIKDMLRRDPVLGQIPQYTGPIGNHHGVIEPYEANPLVMLVDYRYDSGGTLQYRYAIHAIGNLLSETRITSIDFDMVSWISLVFLLIRKGRETRCDFTITYLGRLSELTEPPKYQPFLKLYQKLVTE